MPTGAAPQRVAMGEDEAAGGCGVLSGDPVHLYVMGDRFVCFSFGS